MNRLVLHGLHGPKRNRFRVQGSSWIDARHVKKGPLSGPFSAYVGILVPLSEAETRQQFSVRDLYVGLELSLKMTWKLQLTDNAVA